MSSSQKFLIVSAVLIFLLVFAAILYLRTDFLPRRVHFPPAPVDTLAHKAYNLPAQNEVNPDQLLAPFLENYEIKTQITSYSEGKRHLEGGKLRTDKYVFTQRDPVCTESGQNLYGDWYLEITEYESETYAVIDFNQQLRDAAKTANGWRQQKIGRFLSGKQVVKAEAGSGFQADMEQALQQYWNLRVGTREAESGTYVFRTYGPATSTPCDEGVGLRRSVISIADIPDLAADTLLPRVYNAPLDTFELEKHFFTPYLEELDVEKRETRFVNAPINPFPAAVVSTHYSFSFKEPSATNEQGKHWYNTWGMTIEEFEDEAAAVRNFNRDIMAITQYRKEGLIHQGGDSKRFISGNKVYRTVGGCNTTWFVNDAFYRLLRLVTGDYESEPRTAIFTYCGTGVSLR